MNNKHLQLLRRIAFVASVFAALGSVFSSGCRVRPSETKPAAPQEAARPEIPSPHYIVGQDGDFALDSFKGKPLLISIQGVGTPYWEEQLRELDSINREWATKGLAVVGLLTAFANGEEPTLVVKDVSVSFPLAVAVPDYVSEVAKVRALPTVLLLDDRGAVRKQYPGYLPVDELRSDLEALLAEH